MITGYIMGYPGKQKKELSMREKILRALRNQGPARGQLELGRRVLPEAYSMEDYQEFSKTLRSMLVFPAELKETKKEAWGSVEYEYSLLG